MGDPENPFCTSGRKSLAALFLSLLEENFLHQFVSEPAFKLNDSNFMNTRKLFISNDQNRILSVNLS